MPYQVSMMGWVGSGEEGWVGLGWVQKCWVGFWKSDPWPIAYSTTDLRHCWERQWRSIVLLCVQDIRSQIFTTTGLLMLVGWRCYVSILWRGDVTKDCQRTDGPRFRDQSHCINSLSFVSERCYYVVGEFLILQCYGMDGRHYYYYYYYYYCCCCCCCCCYYYH